MILKMYLQFYINHRQNDWEDWLDTAEFAYNNHWHSGTGVSPFYANYGYHPVFASVPALMQPSAAATIHAKLLSSIHEECRATLRLVQQRQQEHYDCHKGEDPNFQPGDQV